MSCHREQKKSDLTASLKNRSNAFDTIIYKKKIITAIINQLDLWVVNVNLPLKNYWFKYKKFCRRMQHFMWTTSYAILAEYWSMFYNYQIKKKIYHEYYSKYWKKLSEICSTQAKYHNPCFPMQIKDGLSSLSVHHVCHLEKLLYWGRAEDFGTNIKKNILGRLKHSQF